MYSSSLLKPTIRKKEVVKKVPPLLDLPLDLVYDILDELPLSEKILLSQTCRAMWYTLRHKCSSAMRKATAHERLDHLAVLGDVLPDRRLCASCRALHLVDHEDLPMASSENSKTLFLESISGRHCLLPCYYSTAFPHGPPATNHTCLRRLEANLYSRDMRSFRTILRVSSMWLERSARLETKDGRFVLMTHFVFSAEGEPISFSTISKVPLQICPHLRSGPCSSDNPLLEAIRLTCTDGQSGYPQRLHSCDRCPTDYGVSIHGGEASFQVWQDLGFGESPTDPYWCSHIPDKNNGLNRGTKFDYKHGSCEDLYRQAISLHELWERSYTLIRRNARRRQRQQRHIH